MNGRGQTAFEALFVFVIVITATIMITSLYIAISDDTTAISIARAETNRQLAMKTDNVEIQDINISRSTSGTLITINLSKPMPDDFLDQGQISQKIQAQTKLTQIGIQVLPLK